LKLLLGHVTVGQLYKYSGDPAVQL